MTAQGHPSDVSCRANKKCSILETIYSFGSISLLLTLSSPTFIREFTKPGQHRQSECHLLSCKQNFLFCVMKMIHKYKYATFYIISGKVKQGLTLSARRQKTISCSVNASILNLLLRPKSEVQND